MADGFFRASGKLAAVSITSGPAVANIAAAVGQATTDTSAMLVIASAPPSGLIGKNRGGLHDLNEQLEIMKTVARYWARCITPDEVYGKTATLIEHIRAGRPGGAYLEIPTDVMSATTTRGKIESSHLKLKVPQLALIRRAASLLNNSRRPLIILGTGAMLSGAAEAISALAARMHAVISTTTLARGAISCELPNVIFPDGASASAVDDVYGEADVVLAVGTMFKQEDTANWSLRLGSNLIHIDIDRSVFGKSYDATIAIESDARLACNALLRYVKRNSGTEMGWAKRAKEKHEQRLEVRRNRQPREMKLLDALRQLLPPTTQIFTDRCNLGYWMYRCMPFYEPKTFHYPLGYGGLGGTLPQAIGASIARPRETILCVVGDGGLQFSLPELAVAVKQRCKFKIIISNNGKYGAISAGLRKLGDRHTFGTLLWNPQFGKIAEAYSIPYQYAGTESDFLGVLQRELQTRRLAIIEFANDLCDP
jgi:thiamine pyrophosphate-dependent acetolactate synthase large subunit-like protein